MIYGHFHTKYMNRLFSLSSVVHQQFIKKLNALPGTHSELLVAPRKTVVCPDGQLVHGTLSSVSL